MSELVFEKGFRCTTEIIEDLIKCHKFTNEQLVSTFNELLETDTIKISSSIKVCGKCKQAYAVYVGTNIEIIGEQICPYCEE